MANAPHPLPISTTRSPGRRPSRRQRRSIFSVWAAARGVSGEAKMPLL